MRCIWIDNFNSFDVTVLVNGTNQSFIVAAGEANYYPVINVNVPDLFFSVAGVSNNNTNIICLNFVPALNFVVPSPAFQTVTVTNFPFLQNVNINGSIPLTASISNFPAANVAAHIYTASIISADVPIALTSSTLIYGISVYAFNAKAAGNVLTLQVIAGNAVVALNIAVPTDIATGPGISGPIVTLNNLRVVLVNNAIVPKLRLISSGLTSGSYLVTLSTN